MENEPVKKAGRSFGIAALIFLLAASGVIGKIYFNFNDTLTNTLVAPLFIAAGGVLLYGVISAAITDGITKAHLNIKALDMVILDQFTVQNDDKEEEKE